MADLLQPDKNSRENIALFLESIEDEEIRQLFMNHLEDILAVGRKPETQTERQLCFDDVRAIIASSIEKQP